MKVSSINKHILLILIIVFFCHACKQKVAFNRPLLTFRFDDAFANQEQAIAYLNCHKIKASIYAITGHIGKRPYMNANTLRAFYQDGNEVGSHTINHTRLTTVSKKRHTREVIQSKKMLKAIGINARTFAYPYGMYNLLLDNQIQENYSAASVYPLISKGNYNYKTTSNYRLHCFSPSTPKEFELLLKKAIQYNLWMVACFHKIQKPTDNYTISFKTFKKMADIAVKYRKKTRLKIIRVIDGVKYYK